MKVRIETLLLAPEATFNFTAFDTSAIKMVWAAAGGWQGLREARRARLEVRRLPHLALHARVAGADARAQRLRLVP